MRNLIVWPILFIGLVLGSTAAAQQQQNIPLVTYGTWELDYVTPPPFTTSYYASQNDQGYQPYIRAGFEDESEPIYWRNYFVLNLTSLSPSDPISSFTMQLTDAAFTGGTPASNPYYLWSTTSTLSTLQGSGTDASIAESLEGGTLFGQTSSSSAEIGPAEYNITVTGDAAFLSFLNANLGSDVLIAGSQDTMNNPDGYFEDTSPTFTVTTVPEPSASALLLPAIAAGVLLFPRIRRRCASPQ
jgi:hypothetical protein